MAEVYYITSTKCPEPKPRKLKNGDTVYDIVFRVIFPNGDVHQKRLSGYRNKTLAKQAHADFLTKYCELAPKNLQIKKTGILFEEAWGQYFTYILGNMKESSCYTIRNKFKIHILPFFTGKYLDSLTKQDFYSWQDNRLNALNPKTGKRYSRSTVLKIKEHLNAFLEWVDERYEIPNLLQRVKMPKTVKKQSAAKNFDFWEDIEFYKFIDSVDDILYKTLFSFLYFTGCRKGEAISASDEDYTSKGFHVYKTYTNKTLDGSAYKITASKANRDFYVPIVSELKTQMDTYLKWKKENNISSQYLFGGDRPIAPETLRRQFDKYIKIANVKRLRVHWLRHSCASLLIHHGASPQAVADWLGDNVEQIFKTYGHLYDSDREKLCNKISRSNTNND